MARIDRALFDAGIFPVTVTVTTRFDDLDLQNHVNNVAVVALLQEARVAFNAQVGGAEFGLGRVVASLNVDYAGELFHPAPVEVAAAVLQIGRSSITLAQRVRQSGRSAVYAEVTLVTTQGGKPAAIPANLRDRYEALRLRTAEAPK